MRRQGREGTTLLECLVYVACLSIVANALFPVFMDAARLSAYGNIAAERLQDISAFRAAFSKNVHEACRIVDAAGIYFTGNRQIVLELAPDETGTKRYAVIGQIPDAPKMQCLRLHEENGTFVLDKNQIFPLQATEIQFTHLKTLEGVTQVTLDLSLMNAAGKKDKPSVPYHFVNVIRTSGGQS